MRKTLVQGETQPVQLLFVDDEQDVLQYIARSLHTAGYDAIPSASWEDAQLLLQKHEVEPNIIFIEPCCSSGSKKSKSSLREICAQVKEIPVVVLSASRDPRLIVEALRSGVADYIYKPLDLEHLKGTISTILNPRVASVPVQKKARSEETEFVFSNPAMKRIYDTALQISDTKVPVLLHGESGVGKDVIARLIHQKSSLHNKPFVKVNCAAMPAELVESELFGYRKGAFTGAYVDRPGKFQFAHGGTIFLDEIGEFTSSMQAKLLQVLQDGSFTRLGSNQETDVDVRVVAATNRNLEESIKNGSFREDLYYRLNVVSIEVPPLRERRDEILILCNHFLQKFGAEYGSSGIRLPESLEKLFYSFHWPGNIRELENLIKRYIVLQDAKSIEAELHTKASSDIFDEIGEITESYLQEKTGNLDLKELSRKASALAEKNMIVQTLQKTNWNKWKAAKELKVSYKTLLTKIDLYDIEP